MHPGLTSEGALIDTRRVNSAVNAVKVLCTDSESSAYTHIRSTSTGKAKPMNSCWFLFPFVQFDGKSGVTSESFPHGNVCFVSKHPVMEANCQIVFEDLYSSEFLARGYPFPLPGITSISEFWLYFILINFAGKTVPGRTDSTWWRGRDTSIFKSFILQNRIKWRPGRRT
jgi:hypothetical protein